MSIDKNKVSINNESKYSIHAHWDHIVVSVSGGKDSSVLLDYAVKTFPKEKLIAVHAAIDIDWKETLPIVKEQCEFFGVPLKIVQAVNKKGEENGFIKVLTGPRKNRETGEIGEYKFPFGSTRWCTSILKTGPINKFCNSLDGRILVLIGERREESPKRKKLEAWRPDANTTCASKGRETVKFSPILDMKADEVWKIIKDNKIPTHPCYGWGVSRASCAICVFSSNKEIKIAAERAPEIVARYLEAEKQIAHTFRYKAGTKKKAAVKQTVQNILDGAEYDFTGQRPD